LGLLIARIHVRMPLACQLAEGALDLLLRRITGHAEDLVVVLVRRCHRFPTVSPAGRKSRAACAYLAYTLLRLLLPKVPAQRRAAGSSTPRGSMGSDRRRTPVASKMALAAAGASPISGVSPAPAGGRSLRSSSTTSISGTSPNRGTRYCEKRGLRMRPPANSICS